MLKRASFVVLMLAIPLATAGFLYLTYWGFHVPARGDIKVVSLRPGWASNPHVRQLASWLIYQNNRLVFDSAKKAIDDNIPDIVKANGTEYRDGWAQVLAFVLMPGTSGALQPNVRSKFVNTNDLGYRGSQNYLAQVAEAARLKAGGTKIAVLTGGSVAYGLYSDNDDTDIVGHLNRLARERGDAIRFYNFAMGSYTSADELNALVTYAAALEPDLLIAFHGFNDAIRLTESTTYNMGIGVPSMYRAFRGTHPIAFKSEYLDRVYDVENISPEQEIEFFEFYSRNIRLMSSIMSGEGKGMVVATQPVSWFRNVCYKNPSKFLSDFARFYPKMIAAARSISAKQAITYLDLTGAFEGPADRCQGTFADSVHMTSAGQRVMAEHLYPASIKALSQRVPAK